MTQTPDLSKSLEDPVIEILPEPKRRAKMLHFLFKDHAVLRAVWRNYARIDEKVSRSSQPSPAQIKRYKAEGIENILNLRGDNPDNSFYYFERETCQKLNIRHLSVDFHAGGQLPPVENLLVFHRFIDTAKGGVLFHCKTGADRTGFAAALYILMFKGIDFDLAESQLNWRYMHFKSRRMGIFDYALAAYKAAYLASGIGILDWINTEYDPDALMKSYLAKLAGNRA